MDRAGIKPFLQIGQKNSSQSSIAFVIHKLFKFKFLIIQVSWKTGKIPSLFFDEHLSNDGSASLTRVPNVAQGPHLAVSFESLDGVVLFYNYFAEDFSPPPSTAKATDLVLNETDS